MDCSSFSSQIDSNFTAGIEKYCQKQEATDDSSQTLGMIKDNDIPLDFSLSHYNSIREGIEKNSIDNFQLLDEREFIKDFASASDKANFEQAITVRRKINKTFFTENNT